MTGLQLATLVLVLLGALALGSTAAVVGFITGLVLGWVLWAPRPGDRA